MIELLSALQRNRDALRAVTLFGEDGEVLEKQITARAKYFLKQCSKKDLDKIQLALDTKAFADIADSLMMIEAWGETKKRYRDFMTDLWILMDTIRREQEMARKKT